MPSYKMEVKHLNSPDEVRKFENGKIELVKMGGGTIGRAKFEPGWRWSKHVKPIAKTDSCAGEISLVPPGHDAWVVGNEPVVVVDFQGLTDYAKQSAKK